MNRFVLSTLSIAITATTAIAHPHINMVPASTSEGSQLSISHYGDLDLAIVEVGGRKELHYGGSIYTVTADTITANQYDGVLSGLAGMRRGSIINFASDSAPDLNNPITRTQPVGYEIMSVTNVDTTDSARVLWQMFRVVSGNLALPAPYGGHDTFGADSDGATQLDRSYLLQVGAHVHGSTNPDSGFFLFTDAPHGAYDISVRAWDVEGYFTASEPVTFRLNVVPEPASLLFIGAAGMLLLPRRRR